MEADRILHYLLKEFDKLKVEQAEFLGNGRAGDFSEYRHVCGIIRGLNHADTIVRDLVQRLEIDDE